MTSSINIFGASDDLICFAGDLAEEIDDPKQLGATLEFGDAFADPSGKRTGTVLTIRWTTRGTWAIEAHQHGSADYAHVPAAEGIEPDEDYSDVVTLTGELRWVRVLHGTDIKEYPL